MTRVLRTDGPLWWVRRHHPGVGRTDYDKVGRILRGFQVRHEFIRHKVGACSACPPGASGTFRYSMGPISMRRFSWWPRAGKARSIGGRRGRKKCGPCARKRAPGYSAAFPIAPVQRLIEAGHAVGPVLDPSRRRHYSPGSYAPRAGLRGYRVVRHPRGPGQSPDRQLDRAASARNNEGDVGSSLVKGGAVATAPKRERLEPRMWGAPGNAAGSGTGFQSG